MLSRILTRGLLATMLMLTFFSVSALSETNSALVTTEWLAKQMDDPNLVILDCTVKMMPDGKGGMQSISGFEDYQAGHIPSAGFADLKTSLCDVSSEMNFAMPTAEQFCELMGKLGVGDDSRVVLYDGFNSVWAARVWWMLRWVGFDNAVILDGGFKAWKAEDRPVSTKPATHAAKKLIPIVRPSLISYKDEVLGGIEDDGVVIMDAMPEMHYTGKMVMYGRPGHIPTAVNVSAMAILDSTGHYLPREQLAAMFDFGKKSRVIIYCGAGVAASSNAFVLTRLGYEDVAVYMASLQEWAADPEMPLVVE